MSWFRGRSSLLLLLSAIAYGQAQNVSPKGAPLHYDVAQETTLTGTVAGLTPVALPGSLSGAHLTLTTPGNTIDISLGAFAFTGKGALSVTEGQQVEVTGVFKNVHGGPVLLARLVKVGDTLYAIRNIHGLPVNPSVHEHQNQQAQNGETR